ncbi:MATE family efflux transporter [Chitinilyticum aquatile]|uniref:MATE family efflux transporter n=1 Tax=Chitinilyticum aquatile TaxID=362520 RepID=UPI0006891660|nr:MATE family efflux transporter [Chitinilyticum aquatile]
MPLPRHLHDARQTWALAWPMIISQLAGTGMGFIDSVMAGHASAADLAVISVGASVWLCAMVTLMGLALAVSPLVAHQAGAGNVAAIAHWVQQALWQVLLTGALFTLLFQFAGPWIFPRLGLAPRDAGNASQFLAAIGWGVPPLAMQRVLGSYSTAIGLPRTMMVIAVATLLLNIPLNWIFVYGHLGAPALGGVGCGVASSTCAWLGALAAILWIRFTPAYRASQPFCNFRAPHWTSQQQLFRLGLPIGLTFLVQMSAFACMTLLLVPLGSMMIAAHQIAQNLGVMLVMIPTGLSKALTVRIGQALGAQNQHAARQTAITGLIMGLLIATVSAMLLCLGHDVLPSLYTRNQAVRLIASDLLMIAAVCQLFDTGQILLAGILRGYKITSTPLLVCLPAFWLVALPLGYLLAFGHGDWQGVGVRGFWLALLMALGIIAAVLLGVFRKVSNSSFRRPLPCNVT